MADNEDFIWCVFSDTKNHYIDFDKGEPVRIEGQIDLINLATSKLPNYLLDNPDTLFQSDFAVHLQDDAKMTKLNLKKPDFKPNWLTTNQKIAKMGQFLKFRKNFLDNLRILVYFLFVLFLIERRRSCSWQGCWLISLLLFSYLPSLARVLELCLMHLGRVG